MKKLKEILKTNSSFSSNLDIGLGNSLQGDLSSVEENIKEDSNQDVYHIKIDRPQNRRAVASSDKKKGQRHRFKLEQTKQQVIHRHQHEVSLENKEQQIYSKAGAHYFINKMHVKENIRPFQSESKRNSKLFHNEFQNLFDINKNKVNLETDIQKIKYDENLDDYVIHDKLEKTYLPQVNKEYQASVATADQLDQLINSQGSFSSSVTDENSYNGEDHFQLSLSVNYQTHFGQEIGIIGNIPQLGLWDIAKPLKMRWTEGHNWIAEDILISEAKGDPTYFMYKYCLLQDGKFQFFEKGLDRIVDLKIVNFKSISISQLRYSNSNKGYRQQDNQQDKLKQVEIIDKWEYFAVNFQVFNPGKNIQNKIEMRVNGDREQIGNWKNKGPQPMILDQQTSNWLKHEKYGQQVQPFQFPCNFQNNQQHTPVVVRYNYSKKFKDCEVNQQEVEWEREPCRVMEISDPKSYKGQLRKKKNRWINSQQVWVVNGQINKVDSNFKAKFSFSEVGDTGLYVGNYPLNEQEIKSISNEGITAVLNLKSKTQNFDYIKEIYSKNGINLVLNYPIPEFNKTANLCEKLFEASKIINWIVNEQKHKKIFVHCSAGMTRSPTLAILYLCLYCRISCWQSPVEVYKILKKNRDMIFPNMKAVFKTILQNRQLQYENCILLQQENQLKQIKQEKIEQDFYIQIEIQKQKLNDLTKILEERRQQKKDFKLERFDQQADEVDKRLQIWRNSEIEKETFQKLNEQNINSSESKKNKDLSFQEIQIKEQQIILEVNEEFQKQEQVLEDQILKTQINEAKIISENKRLLRLMQQTKISISNNNRLSMDTENEKVSEYNTIQGSVLEQKWSDQLVNYKESERQKANLSNKKEESSNLKIYNQEEIDLRSKKFSDSMNEIDKWDNIEETFDNNQESKILEFDHENLRQSSQIQEYQPIKELNQDEDKRSQFYYEQGVQQDQEIPINKSVDGQSQTLFENYIGQDAYLCPQEQILEKSNKLQKSQDDASPVNFQEDQFNIQNLIYEFEIGSPQIKPHQNELNLQKSESKHFIKIDESYKKLQKITTDRQVFQRNYISPNRISFIESPENQQHSEGNFDQIAKINEFEQNLDYNEGEEQQEFKYIKIEETDISIQKPDMSQDNQFDTFVETQFENIEQKTLKFNENGILSSNYSFSQIQGQQTSLQAHILEKSKMLQNLEIKLNNQNFKDTSVSELPTPCRTINEVLKFIKNQEQNLLSQNQKKYILTKLFCINFEINFPSKVLQIKSQQDLQDFVKKDSASVMELIKDNNDMMNEIIQNKKNNQYQIFDIYQDLKNLKKQQSQIQIEQDLQALQISEKELENLCIDLFDEIKILPLNYFIEDYSTLEQQIMITLKNFDIKIPVVHLKDELYFVGIYKVQCHFKDNQVQIKINDHFENFNKFIIKNEKYIQKCLILSMLKFDQSFEFIIDSLINDNDISYFKQDQKMEDQNPCFSDILQKDNQQIVKNDLKNQHFLTNLIQGRISTLSKQNVIDQRNKSSSPNHYLKINQFDKSQTSRRNYPLENHNRNSRDRNLNFRNQKNESLSNISPIQSQPQQNDLYKQKISLSQNKSLQNNSFIKSNKQDQRTQRFQKNNDMKNDEFYLRILAEESIRLSQVNQSLKKNQGAKQGNWK